MDEKSCASRGNTDPCTEESGWTSYFEDFSNENDVIRENPTTLCWSTKTAFNDIISSSWVSDAASSSLSSALKLSSTYRNGYRVWPITDQYSMKLLNEKPKTRKIVYDESLEDTATSPVNYSTDDHKRREVETDEEIMSSKLMNTKGRKEIDKRADLKKKGLFLCPC